MTRIWGVSMVRNEADIVELTLRHLTAQGVDHLLVANNLSTDGTKELLDRLTGEVPLTVVQDDNPAYRQSEKMTALAARAAAGGAEWIVPFDADELWRSRVGTVRDAIEETEASILTAPMFEHHPRPTFRRGTVVERMPWNRTSGWTKVAFRWRPEAVIAYGNHEVYGVDGEPERGRLFVDHYPFRSWPQYRSKIQDGARAVELANVPPDLCWHWREAAALSTARLQLRWWGIRLHPKLRHRDRADGF